MKMIIKTWKTIRSLTLVAKVAVLKGFVMSMVAILLLALSCPNREVQQSIDELVADFPWSIRLTSNGLWTEIP